ncbi:hypothetical protein GOV13_02930 [Candidatus Pacearchaeota archaeon]|nr:hypothetical protein [Candidatus Pacearchaeota archaeon]
MKKSMVMLLVLVMLSFTVSAACNLDVSLVNQDPYPAVPGDYVKIVFQVTGTENPECRQVSVELLEKYPISFDPGESPLVQVTGGVYDRDYSSYLTVPYKVRLDGDALDGENQVEVRFGTGDLAESSSLKSFNIEVDDTHADFEIFVKDYNPTTKKLTFEILNIAAADVEALTLEIPRQEGVSIQGSKTNIVGDLDSNEYTTADFTAALEKGDITIKIYYSDTINERRTLEKTVAFDPSYFASTDVNGGRSWKSYLFYVIVIGGIVYYFYNRRKKKKHKHHKHHSRKGSAAF